MPCDSKSSGILVNVQGGRGNTAPVAGLVHSGRPLSGFGGAKDQLPLKLLLLRLEVSVWRARKPALIACFPRVVVRVFDSSKPLLKVLFAV